MITILIFLEEKTIAFIRCSKEPNEITYVHTHTQTHTVAHSVGIKNLD